MDLLCGFGPIKVLFKALPCHRVWPFWSWKLDQYKIESGQPNIVVDYEEQLLFPQGELVFEDEQGCIIRQIYALADGRLLWQQTDKKSGTCQLQYVVSADRKSITLTSDRSDTVGMGAFESLTFLIFYLFIYQKVLTFHGVLIEERGRGFLVCAESGVGKTTHARLWRDSKNALIINGDRATCFESNGSWYGFGTPWCGTSGENINRTVKLQAVVILDRGEQNEVTKETGMSLLNFAVYPSWHREMTEEMLSLLDRFLEKLPILRLQCTKDVRSVDTLYGALENIPL